VQRHAGTLGNVLHRHGPVQPHGGNSTVGQVEPQVYITLPCRFRGPRFASFPPLPVGQASDLDTMPAQNRGALKCPRKINAGGKGARFVP
jgi:hypothetical protein